MVGQPDVHAALRVVLAATRALLSPDAGLTGRSRELAESAGRNAERLARLMDKDDRPSTRGLVDVAAALGVPQEGGGTEPLWAIVDADALRRGVEDFSQAARSNESVSVRAGSEGSVEVVVTLPGLMSPMPSQPAGWKPFGV